MSEICESAIEALLKNFYFNVKTFTQIPLYIWIVYKFG